jgi:phosphodiester glycosidase
VNFTTRPPRRTVPKAIYSYRWCYAALAVAAFACCARASAAELPVALAPPAPFPLVTGSSFEREAVAPGVTHATYRLITSAGPLVVSVVTVDLREPSVRLGAVLAHDALRSSDEAVSSMARRTGAVAGINGDYFDINASGAPVGVLVRGGALDRSPSDRVALTVTTGREVRFEPYAFSGAIDYGAIHVPLTGVNAWPPQTGATLLTRTFGTPPPADGVWVLELVPFGGAPGSAPRYRVTSVTQQAPYPGGAALRLAYGPAAQAFGPLPDVGDVVSLAYDTDPPLATIAAAIGGGPLLLHGGAAVDDPASPNYAVRDRRIPASAAARFPSGMLGLVVVDGRHPATSIGVSRAELIALLQAIGATDAMLFDSGGSATLVARVLGDAVPSVVNEPSDGVERPVADGLFVYSDAPVGPPSRLVVRPERIVAVAGARVPLRARLIDAQDHGLGDARGAWHLDAPPNVAAIGDDDVLQIGARTGTYALRVARGGVATDVPLEIVDRVTRLAIGPARAGVDPHGSVQLTLDAFDARDRPVAVAGTVRWSASNATVDAGGRLTAGDRDARVSAVAGGILANATIPVGTHLVPLGLFDDVHRAAWTFATVPANGPGAVDVGAQRLNLAYDFSARGRAAYAVATPDLSLGDATALTCAFDADGNGAALRATLSDRYGDRTTVTFARALDMRDTRRLTAAVPRSLAPPVALHAIYVVGTLANPVITAAGSLGVHECAATVPGTQAP